MSDVERPEVVLTQVENEAKKVSFKDVEPKQVEIKVEKEVKIQRTSSAPFLKQTLQ